MGNPLRWRGHEVSRLEGFSYTVFAFALTLLVVALEVPHNYEKLIHLMMGFPSFACCFTLLIWIWSQHNASGHWWYGARSGRQRRELEAELASAAIPAATA